MATEFTNVPKNYFKKRVSKLYMANSNFFGKELLMKYEGKDKNDFGEILTILFCQIST